MKKLAPILLLALVVLLMAGSASAKPRAGCVVKFTVVHGFGEQLGGLTVMVDGDYESYRTSATAPTILTFDVDNQLKHAVNVLSPEPGRAWSMTLTCVQTGVSVIEAQVQ